MSLSCAGLVQNNRVSKPLSAEQVISRIISTGISEGHDSKILAGTGEKAAAIVTNVTKDKKLTTVETDSILFILNNAFAGRPPLAPDAQRSGAMALLRRLDASTDDIELKKRIGHTTKLVQDCYVKARSLNTSSQ
jgi:hypothetical protein